MHSLWKPVSAAWYQLPYHGTRSVATPTAGDCYYVPMYMNRLTIDKIAAEITTQGVSASGTDVLRVGLYNASSTTGLPSGSPVIDFGTIDLEGAAAVTVLNVTNTALTPGLYWFAIVRQTTGTVGTPAVLRLSAFVNANASLIYQTGVTPTLGAGAREYCLKETGVNGALSTPGTMVASSDQVPVILYQVT